MSVLLSAACGGSQTSPAANPVAAGDYGPPPAGVALIYIRDPNHPGWYVGFDWSPKPRGTVKLEQPLGVNAALIQSPDGSFFAVSPSGKGDVGGQLLDRLGRPISGNGGVWSDDSAHTCSIVLDQQKFTWTLFVGGPNQTAHSVALLAQDSGIGQTGISLAACSFRQDRAIAYRTSISSPSEMWVVRLSNGQVLAHGAIANGKELSNIVASPDGALEAENSKGSFTGLGTSTQRTVVRRLSDRTVVATFDPTNNVIGFSADDSLALVTTSPLGGNSANLVVFDLAAGKAIWHYDGPLQYVAHLAEPGGSGLAIMLGGVERDTPITVALVFTGGSWTDLPSGYLRP